MHRCGRLWQFVAVCQSAEYIIIQMLDGIHAIRNLTSNSNETATQRQLVVPLFPYSFILTRGTDSATHISLVHSAIIL